VHDTSGRTLADAPRTGAVASTDVFRDIDRDADARVQAIVATNGGSHGPEARRTAVAAKPAQPVHAS